MGKALKTAGVIIGAAALIATGVGALAMPGLAGTTTLFGVSTGTLNTISSGLVAVGGMLDKPKSKGSAQPGEWTSNPDQPIPFLFGRMGVAGKIVQRDEFGPDNMYQGIVGILSGAGPIKGVLGFKGDDQPVTFGANGIAITSQWDGEMWMVRRAGNQPDTALSVPSGLKSGGTPFQWSGSARLSGKACYLQILGENSKGSAYPAGVPDPVHEGEGIYGYDPRYDSTYPGGYGPCRLGVRSTYRYIDNAIIGGLNWALGLVENGKVVGGIGASPDGIDFPAFVEAANISDANRWTVSAWPDTSEDVSAVLDQFLQAGGAVRARHAGKISCVSRAAPRASVVTITARDMAGTIELNTAPSLFDSLNSITPRFMSEAAGWKLTPADPVSFASLIADDGGKHSDQIDYRFVPLLKQAAELAAYDILDAREPFSGSVPLKPHMRQLKRGDCFVIDEPGALLDKVKCIVLTRSYDPKTAQVRIGFRSETDSKHPLALGKTTTMPDFPVLTATDPRFVSPPGPEDWVITPRPPAPGGGQLPAFDLTGIVSNSTATAIIVETGPTAAGPWKQAYQGPPTVTTIPVDGLQPGAICFLAVQYQRNQNYSERYIYGPYTAPGLIGDVIPNAPGLSQIKSDIDAAFGDIFEVSAILRQTRSDLEAADAALGSAIGSLDTRADILEVQTQSLEANKASVASLNAQVVRINGVEAVNADQALALVDLENGKVGLSEYNTLKGEVTAARDGSPSLLGKIENLKSVDLDLQTNKASVASVNGLTARTANTEADIIDLELALSTETGARAQAIQQVTARQNISRNLLPGGSGERGVVGWNAPAGFAVVESPANGGTVFYKNYTGAGTVEHLFISPMLPLGQAAHATLSFKGGSQGFTGGVRQGYLAFYNDAGGYVGESATRPLTGGEVTAPKPSGATRAAFVAKVTGTAGSGYAEVFFNQIKIEPGQVATIYSNDALEQVLSAQVTQQSLAIIDLELQQDVAYFEVAATASSGLPAMLQLLSGAGGGYAALIAPIVALMNSVPGSDPLVAMQAIGGEVFFPRPVYVDLAGRRLIVGPGNGWVLWFGPDTINAASATRTNGYFALGTDGKVYYGSAELGSGATGGAAANRASVSGTVGSASFVTLASVAFTGRPSSGFWSVSVTGLSGLSSATGNNVEFRVIEQGATSALTSGTVSVPGGSASALLDLSLSPTGLLPQMQSAGSITLQLQARRVSGTGSVSFDDGVFSASYTPAA